MTLELKTFANANSGVYFHSDTSRTAGLWGIQDFREVVVPDGRWFTMTIRVQGQRVQTWIDARQVADYTEEPNPPRTKGLVQRRLLSGTFALQGHDPGSEAHVRTSRVRVLAG